MALDVKVTIDVLKAPGKVGLGYPLILLTGASSAKNYTEVSSLDEVVTAGYAATTTMYKAANTLFMQNNAPDKIAVCTTDGTAQTWLAVSENINKGWRQLIVIPDGESTVSVSGIMSVIEATDDKMYFADLAVDDSTSITVSGINRTVLFYCTGDDNHPVPSAALVGASSGLDAGSFTYKNLILKGIPAQSLTDSEISAIHTKGGITFVNKAGDNVTSEGKTAGGEYIDIIDSKDYIISNLIYKTQKTLNESAKIPYDDTGIAILESVCTDVMADAFNKGIIASDTNGRGQYTVNYLARSETEASDRAERRYIGGRFAFVLAGAIHEVEINGEIII